MPPAKTPDVPTSDSEYFAIARRQADALNELDAKLSKQEDILRNLVTEAKSLVFRVEALEQQPVPTDYGNRPANDLPRPIRKRAEFCTECGGPLPNYHFDNCSQYRSPAA